MDKSELSTWKIVQTKNFQFQWVLTTENPISRSNLSPKTLDPEKIEKIGSRLPSMKDLLLQVDHNSYLSHKTSFVDQIFEIPLGAMFSSGSGKTLSVRQSSMEKARSLFEGEDSSMKDRIQVEQNDCLSNKTCFKSGCVRDDNGGFAMFSSGSGRALSVRKSSVEKAKSLFEEEDLADKEIHGGECFPMFRTGLGKSVIVRKSSIKKAAALLEVNNDMEEKLNIKDAIKDTRIDFPPLKFQTAGGRSIQISSDALKRARMLLNESELEALEGETKTNAFTCSTSENDKIYNESSSNLKKVALESLHEGSFMNKPLFENSSSVKHFCSPLMVPSTSTGLSNQVEFKHDHHSNDNGSSSKVPNEELSIAQKNVHCYRMIRGSSSGKGALLDISNYSDSSLKNRSSINGVKKRLGKEFSCSSFKRPRTSSFSSLAATEEGDIPSTSANCCCRRRVSSRFPFRGTRKKLKEFFGAPPGQFNKLESIPDSVRYMTPDSAEKYRFHDTCSSGEFGPEAFQEMLLQSGALLSDTSEKWVANHYKWIVWKLACFERSYPHGAIGRFLTVPNVLEELKYRYEREINYGHRSALKKILDGDVPPSSMMILCVSAIYSYSDPGTDGLLGSSNLHGDGKKLIGVGSDPAMKIELTDGWYSLDARLDGYLSKQLLSGKLFVGQKLRICGAALCGWVEPLSPLEASNSVYLVLNINGTHRAHWDDSLGLCRGFGAPLAFRCIRNGGGRVPKTLVGVTRLYPVLYKERLPDGCSIVRSESMEKRILEFNSKRRSGIAEDIISELEGAPLNVNDSDEGAKLHRILESSAEPEVLMAEMSLEQLSSFSIYQAKQEALRQANLHKKIETALEEAGLGSRDVTPFMRVRVIGLTSKDTSWKGRPREGLITIWNPTEKQKIDLVEGQIYTVSWLAPYCGSSDLLYLQSRGPSSAWIRLPATESKKYECFFIPRKSVFLSNLGEVPLSSEFDIAAVVVYVGEAYLSGCQKKQWIFVTDGLTEDEHGSLLAINFCSPIFGIDSLAPINQCLEGNTVGFCNLMKRARDQKNHLWVAEATENSTYSISANISCDSHLKGPADLALKWAKTSSLALKKLHERVLSITGDHEI